MCTSTFEKFKTNMGKKLGNRNITFKVMEKFSKKKKKVTEKGIKPTEIFFFLIKKKCEDCLLF